jgi:hypothetical protein
MDTKRFPLFGNPLNKTTSDLKFRRQSPMPVATMAKVKVLEGEWECMECGYVVEGVSNKRPKACPDCQTQGSNFEFFEFTDDDYDDYDDYDDDDDYDDYDDD